MPEGGEQPDIVLVMSDEHAPRFSSIYGHRIVHTPHMERLAAEGLVFDAAYCASPICVPSRMAFMTGRYTTRTETWDNGTPLRSDIPTFAHVMQQAGYDTVLIGKMHFIGPDQLHGFSRRLVDDSRVCGTWIDTNDWDDPDAPRAKARQRLLNAGEGRTAHIEQDEDVLAAALRFLEDLPPRAERAPLFLCVSFNAPHFPLRAPRHFDRYWPDNVNAPTVTQDELDRQHPFHKRLRGYFDLNGINAQETLRGRAAFYALVTWFDELLGTLLDAIDAAPGLGDDPPLVGYLSDHGDMAGEHGLWWKCCFFEDSVRVPLVLRWPEKISAGTRTATPVSLMDLGVTLARLSNPGPIADVFFDLADGEDISGIFSGEERPNRAVISEYCGHAAARPIRMIRKGRWKYVYYHGEPDELYDLLADPGEKTNLAASADMQDIIGDLKAMLLDNWDADAIDRRVREHQRERALIAEVEGHGTFE